MTRLPDCKSSLFPSVNGASSPRFGDMKRTVANFLFLRFSDFGRRLHFGCLSQQKKSSAEEVVFPLWLAKRLERAFQEMYGAPEDQPRSSFFYLWQFAGTVRGWRKTIQRNKYVHLTSMCILYAFWLCFGPLSFNVNQL